jgi:hypothetical protein
MTIKHFIEPGLSLLPERMDTPEARIMLVAIGLQESRFEYRFQIGGPARGFWQFEKGGGVAGVITHGSTRESIARVCSDLRFECTPESCYIAIAYSDALACVFARLLLWTLPLPLPGNTDSAWNQYLQAWRPGKPHPEMWDGHYAKAKKMVTGG